MKKILFVAASLLAATAPCSANVAVNGESFDVLASVMETHRNEYNAKEVLASSKGEAIKYREKMIAGWWEFMQANSKAKPGEYCSATFLRAQRVKHERVDNFSNGVMVSLFGPGGSYRGALLGFSPLDKDHGFPKLQSGKPVLMTLKQGNLKPVTLNAIYMKVSPTAPPLVVFAVPTIEALMDGMEDDWRFELVYEGQSIADVTWHDGLKAREELKKCLAGKNFGHIAP